MQRPVHALRQHPKTELHPLELLGTIIRQVILFYSMSFLDLSSANQSMRPGIQAGLEQGQPAGQICSISSDPMPENPSLQTRTLSRTCLDETGSTFKPSESLFYYT